MDKLENKLGKVRKALDNYNRWAGRLGYLENELVVKNKDGITCSLVNQDGQRINLYGGSYALKGGCVSYDKFLLWQILCDIFMQRMWNKLSKKVSHLNLVEHTVKRAKHIYGD